MAVVVVVGPGPGRVLVVVVVVVGRANPTFLTKKTKDGYQVDGGDNVAESLLGHIKTTMRRTAAVRGGHQGSKLAQAWASQGAARIPELAAGMLLWPGLG